MTHTRDSLMPCPFCGASAWHDNYGGIRCTNNPSCVEGVSPQAWSHRAELSASAKGSHGDELDAAYKFVESMVPRADDHTGYAPKWHGWALREAFMAGTKYAHPAPTEPTAANFRQASIDVCAMDYDDEVWQQIERRARDLAEGRKV